MLSIVYSSHLGDYQNKKFNKHIKDTIGLNPKKYEILCYENYNEYSLTEIYNKGLKDAKYDYVAFIHNDIEFDTKNWGLVLTKIFDNNEEYGIIGVAGSKFLHNSGKWWENTNSMYGIVNHQKDGKKWASVYSQESPNNLEEVLCLDGVFFAVDKNYIKNQFDETYKGFHFYDITFTFKNYLNGVKLGVTTDIRITHNSIGETNQQWEDNRQQFVNQYKDNLPLQIKLSKDTTQSFIFCHDQDIILRLEEKENFKHLNDYKYVFLDYYPHDKIKNIDNVIIGKDMEYHMSDYRYLLSYGGWWIVWKNDLIKSKKVNLLEYDVEISPDFELKSDIFYNKDIVSYKPFPTNNYHFINNPDWVSYLFKKVKEVYGLDLKTLTQEYINKGLKYWMATSNMHMSKDFFYQYMEWCDPIINEIKEDKMTGHALERLITMYCLYVDKQYDFNTGVLNHFQLDSHKTQGHNVTKTI